jgi:hypothetical protein
MQTFLTMEGLTDPAEQKAFVLSHGVPADIRKFLATNEVSELPAYVQSHHGISDLDAFVELVEKHEGHSDDDDAADAAADTAVTADAAADADASDTADKKHPSKTELPAAAAADLDKLDAANPSISDFYAAMHYPPTRRTLPRTSRR